MATVESGGALYPGTGGTDKEELAAEVLEDGGGEGERDAGRGTIEGESRDSSASASSASSSTTELVGEVNGDSEESDSLRGNSARFFCFAPCAVVAGFSTT